MKNIIKILTLTSIMLSSISLKGSGPYDSFFFPFDYIFGGYMTIAADSNAQLKYSVYTWNNTSNSFEANQTYLEVNKLINLRDGIFYGFDNCPKMTWGSYQDSTGQTVQAGTTIILVPIMPPPQGGSESPQQFEADLKAGKKAPYVLIERNDRFLNIFIINAILATDPTQTTNIIPVASQKLSFNITLFENLWVSKSAWFTKAATDYISTIMSEGKHFKPSMIFSFAFDATLGTFKNSPLLSGDSTEGQLSDDSFYIFGLTKKDGGLGWSWTQQNSQPEPRNVENMTMKALQDQSVVTFEAPLYSLEELQRVINLINWATKANIQSVM